MVDEPLSVVSVHAPPCVTAALALHENEAPFKQVSDPHATVRCDPWFVMLQRHELDELPLDEDEQAARMEVRARRRAQG